MSRVFKDYDLVDETLQTPDAGAQQKDDADRNRVKTDSSATNNEISPEVREKSERILWQARMESYQLLEQAAAQVESIRKQAAAEAAAEKELARKQGYEEGLEQAKTDFREQSQATLEELAVLMGSVEEQKALILEQYENSLKDLALNVAGKVIDARLSSDENAFLALYKSAVAEFNGQEWVRVMVGEEDAAFVTSHVDLLKSMTKDTKDIKVVVLAKAPRGTCVVETSQTIVDASVETQMSKIRQVFVKTDLSLAN